MRTELMFQVAIRMCRLQWPFVTTAARSPQGEVSKNSPHAAEPAKAASLSMSGKKG
jgi:hypothetical protein